MFFFCNILTKDQKTHLSTPAYQNEKEKHDQKAIQEESSSHLLDPTLVSCYSGSERQTRFDPRRGLSSTPAVKVKKTKGPEELSSRNVKDRNTQTKRQDEEIGLTG